MVERVTRQRGRDTAGEAGAFLVLDAGQRSTADAVDDGLFYPVFQPRPHVPRRQAGDTGQAEIAQRIRRAQGATGSATGKPVELQAPVKKINANAERLIIPPGFGEPELEVLPDAAHVGVEHQALAATEKVTLRNTRVEQHLVGRTETGTSREGARSPLSHLHEQVELVFLVGALGDQLHRLKKTGTLHLVLAFPQARARKTHAFPEHQLAANDLVPCLCVASDVDAANVNHRSAGAREADINEVGFRVNAAARLYVGKRVALVAVDFYQ